MRSQKSKKQTKKQTKKKTKQKNAKNENKNKHHSSFQAQTRCFHVLYLFSVLAGILAIYETSFVI